MHVQFVFIVSSIAISFLHLFYPTLVSIQTQLTILAVFICLLGLPHGALDPWLARKAGLISDKNPSWQFNILYLSVALIVVFLWSFFPFYSLLIFLIISSWHFSADWIEKMPTVQRLLMGILVILLPIGFHSQEVSVLFQYLSNHEGKKIAQLLTLPFWMLSTCVSILSLLALLRSNWLTAIECFVFLFLAVAMPPLIYFAVYFCFRHSPFHFLSSLKIANSEERSILKKTIPFYTALTLIPLSLLALWWSDLPSEELLMRTIFVGLAALTVPHMALIEWSKYINGKKSL